jgi:glycosyltransferase involved in cell wall biosynthesis
MPVTVVYFHRKPGPGHFSLERVFSDVREHLPSDIDAKTRYCPRPSKGIFNRIANVLWARRNQGDISHITGDVHYLAVLLRKRTTILTIHDCVSLERSRGLRRWLLWFLWFRFPQSRCARTTAISEFTKKELVRYLKCPPEKIVVVHDPANTDFRPFSKPFNSKCPVVLQVGTGWNKNLERIAMALKGVSCRLEIVGPVRDAQRAILAANGILYSNHLHISNRELLSLYQECDLVVFASLYEGFGLPIVEAQAVGRPVITSNRCSMPEVAGGAACLVDPETVDSIREGILRVISEEPYREELVRQGYENVKRFSPDRIAAQYAELYRNLGE